MNKIHDSQRNYCKAQAFYNISKHCYILRHYFRHSKKISDKNLIKIKKPKIAAKSINKLFLTSFNICIWDSETTGTGASSPEDKYSIYVLSPVLYALNQEGSIIFEWISTTSLSVIKRKVAQKLLESTSREDGSITEDGCTCQVSAPKGSLLNTIGSRFQVVIYFRI